MANELIERVARAIAASKRGAAPMSPLIDGVWPSYVGQACAAVEAMREPTEAMIVAGADSVWSENANLPRTAQEATMAVGFAAMIDAALKDA